MPPSPSSRDSLPRGTSPLTYHSKSGPTSSCSSAMKPSTDTTACVITVLIRTQTIGTTRSHRVLGRSRRLQLGHAGELVALLDGDAGKDESDAREVERRGALLEHQPAEEHGAHRQQREQHRETSHRD